MAIAREHTYKIEATSSSLRWRVHVDPTRTKHGDLELQASLEVIVEILTDGAAPSGQLEFDF